MDVLLVEDEPLVRELLYECLVDAGLEVVPVGSAEEGLDAVEQHGPPPPVVVTDVNLGHGIDGVALAVEARRRWPSIAVVLMTGDERNLRRLSGEFRASCFLKPFDPDRLVEAVNLRMGRWRPSRLPGTVHQVKDATAPVESWG
jgi:DNA-binding response OmpR family regulator